MFGNVVSRLLNRNSSGDDAVGPVYLKPGIWDLDGLPQFRTAARIEKIVPAPHGEQVESWYGGKPQFPADVPWPTHDGEPMVFLAQIACRELPDDLWGGVGPRDGWLLFFMSVDIDENGLTGSVLHISERGPERTEVLNENWFRDSVWLDRTIKKHTAPSATPFPRWPVRLHGVNKDASDAATVTDQIADGTVSESAKRGVWPSGDAGHPITWNLFDAFLDHVRREIEETPEQIEQLRESLQKKSDGYQTLVPDERKYWHVHEYDQVRSALDKLSSVSEELAEAASRFPALQAEFLENRTGPGPDARTWSRCLQALSEIPEFSTEWIETEKGYDSNLRYSFEYQKVSADPDMSIDDLEKALTEVIANVSALHQPRSKLAIIRENIQNRSETVTPPNDPTPEIVDYFRKRNQLTRENLDAIDTAMAFSEKVYEAATAVRKQVQAAKEAGGFSAAEWSEILDRFSKLYTIEKSTERGLDGIPSLNELRFYDRSFADTGQSMSRSWKWRSDFEKRRAMIAREIYCTRPDALTFAVREHFEPLWEMQAKGPHDGMGGEPRWDSTDIRWFDPSLYYAPKERQKVLAMEPYRSPPPAPFDVDNAVLLQLFSDPLMGWMWGDLSHVVFIAPREQIAQGQFTDVVVIVEG